LVFAAEVVIAIGILVGSARIPDALVGERPKLDGAVSEMPASCVVVLGPLADPDQRPWRDRTSQDAMIVFGMPQSSSWR
jgi:hypothetical protein